MITNSDGVEFNLSRYYKGDWSGMYVNTALLGLRGDNVHIITFDCRTEQDELETVIKILDARVVDD